jgi:hypothetical protein
MVITKEMQEDILRAGGSWYIPRSDNVTPKAKDAKDAIVGDMLRAIDESPGEKPRIRKRTFQGIPISLEYEAGERRVIRDDSGKVVYNRILQSGYGYFNNTRGPDGDAVDLILGPDNESKMVYVFQMEDLGPNIDQRENEPKCAIGFGGDRSYEKAENAFRQMYGLHFIGGCETLTMRQFRPWLREHAK